MPGFNKPAIINRLNETGFDYETEFQYYLTVIKAVMEPGRAFLELGPGSFSISDYFPDVTILDEDIKLLEAYAAKGRKVLLQNYHSLGISLNNFDYVVSIHPELTNSGKNIEWLDSEKKEFRFKSSGLEYFVSSLIDLARKRVFIASKTITDNPPMRRLAIRVVTRPYPFVLYEKPMNGGKSKWRS